MATALRTGLRRWSGRGSADGFRYWSALAGLLVPLVLVSIVLVLVLQAQPALSRFGLGFLAGRAWNPVKQEFGALPFLYGTVATSLLALLMALPVGVGVALFLAEPGLPRVRGALGLGVELLAGIPSVVYGIWGLYVLAPWLLEHVSKPLTLRLGGIPVFAGPARQTSLLLASIVIAIMILPTLASISREVLKAVPNGIRESSLALGATWWETVWRVVLPAARAGIFGATVLALGRALGETIAVTMVIGNKPEIQTSLLGPAYTLASVIANEFSEATGQVYAAALLELGLVLVLLTLVINLLALLLVRNTGRQLS
ncbi:MAG: phosphate ABC transporter permease subunit PstC [Candidatus Dormibacteraeota bacterium]|uniref:Phosphate transport system permease protein n=1 Tax=Candidatus Dormiibacter inghamiae TaxID=3127013 RepID=A0A934K749_9BACT|nr:phosphate ABC transporter permease subunit PstC [Candidatus Dormibacteraeota bacterium]MBJ7606844.1 phosphate ABC transporter permease subunit PstC [Candidatus Dormibacteraeota bacterium]